MALPWRGAGTAHPTTGGPAPAAAVAVISVVIPVLDEAETIGTCLDRLGQQPGSFELVVADGGSRDGTPERARGRAQLVRSRPGRGAQKAVTGGQMHFFR